MELPLETDWDPRLATDEDYYERVKADIELEVAITHISAQLVLLSSYSELMLLGVHIATSVLRVFNHSSFHQSRLSDLRNVSDLLD